MRIAIIGRTEILYHSALLLKESGHEISCIVTAKETPEYTRGADDYRRLAELWNVPFAQGPRILEYFDFLRASCSDIAVSVNYSSVIPQEVVDIFPLGILNAHGGDLPRYRGNACQAWAIINGEDRIGLCIHKMIGGELDSDDIIARDYLAIDHTTKVTKAWRWMVKRTPALMVDAVERLASDPDYVLEKQPKDSAHTLRCYPRRPEDGRIDWRLPAMTILRLINASNKPYDGAFCDFDGRPLIIWDAALVEEMEMFLAVPGQITAIGNDFVEVACGEGKLRLLVVELDGLITSPAKVIKSLRARLN